MGSKRNREALELAAFLRRMARALTRRAAQGDLEALEALKAAGTEIDRQMGEAARALHTFGYSWAEIGAAVGSTKQNAQKRWAA